MNLSSMRSAHITPACIHATDGLEHARGVWEGHDIGVCERVLLVLNFLSIELHFGDLHGAAGVNQLLLELIEGLCV